MKYDLLIDPPLTNAAGSLGFSPDFRLPLDWPRLGAFFTNPISLEARHAAHRRQVMPFPGGYLLHTGYPNPGFASVLRQHATRWERSSLPVVVSLLVSHAAELVEMVGRLEGIENLLAIEIGIPPGAGRELAQQLVAAAQGELPVIARLNLERAFELGPALTQADAICLAAPRGALPDAIGRPVQGRLYGPAIFPQALAATRALAGQGLPVLAGGGVYAAWQAAALMEAGALGVQLDGVLWRGGLLENPPLSAPGSG